MIRLINDWFHNTFYQLVIVYLALLWSGLIWMTFAFFIDPRTGMKVYKRITPNHSFRKYLRPIFTGSTAAYKLWHKGVNQMIWIYSRRFRNGLILAQYEGGDLVTLVQNWHKSMLPTTMTTLFQFLHSDTRKGRFLRYLINKDILEMMLSVHCCTRSTWPHTITVILQRSPHQYTVEFWYNAVQYIMILHTALQWQLLNTNPTFSSREKPHISPSWTSYELCVVEIWDKFSRDITTSHCTTTWASYQIHKIAGYACAGNAGNVFPRHRFKRKPLVSDPGMHHGTCVTHVPWCMSGSLTCGDGENVPGIPGACAPAILRIWQEAHGTESIYWHRRMCLLRSF